MPDSAPFSSSDCRIDYRGVGKQFAARGGDGGADVVVAVEDVNLGVCDGEVVSLSESVALSDRVFVMRQRPGTIIEVIEITLPERANPMARRRDCQREIAEYVTRLMGLLHVGEAAAEIEI